MPTRRTTMRSRSGTKLYAVRDESGKFKDIQTYKRAHSADMRHKSKAEKEAARGPIEKKGPESGDSCSQVRQGFGAGRGCRGGAGGETRSKTGREPTARRKENGQEESRRSRPASRWRRPTAKKTARKTVRKRAAKKA